MALFRITCVLARSPEFPDGDARQGYTLVAPLDQDGRLDVEEWRVNKAACTVVRHQPGDGEGADGWLSHSDDYWFFRYDEEDDARDQHALRLGDHIFDVGEHVSVGAHRDAALTYVVTTKQRV